MTEYSYPCSSRRRKLVPSDIKGGKAIFYFTLIFVIRFYLRLPKNLCKSVGDNSPTYPSANHLPVYAYSNSHRTPEGTKCGSPYAFRYRLDSLSA